MKAERNEICLLNNVNPFEPPKKTVPVRARAILNVFELAWSK